MSHVTQLPRLVFHVIKSMPIKGIYSGSSYSATRVGTQIPRFHTFCSNLVSSKNAAMLARISLAHDRLDECVRANDLASVDDDFELVLADPAVNPGRYAGLTRNAQQISQEIFRERVARIDAGAKERAADIERQTAALDALRKDLGPHMERYAACLSQLQAAGKRNP